MLAQRLEQGSALSLLILVDALDEAIDSSIDAQQQQVAHNEGWQTYKSGQCLVDEAGSKDLPDHQVSAVDCAGEHGAEDLARIVASCIKSQRE